MSRERLDNRLARDTGLSRTRAAAAILAGEVIVDGQPARKPGQPVSDEATVVHTPAPHEVSRAAGKLAPVLKTWDLSLQDRVVLDVGASTGGFTQTALEAGAARVYAVDVGHGQLAWTLRNDKRVVNLERTDIRDVSLPEQPDLAVVDVSFISLQKILPTVAALLGPAAPVVALFKPQFQVGRKEASRGKGVIRDPVIVERARDELVRWLGEERWELVAQAPSEVVGTKGNQEWLLWLRTPKVH